MRVSTVRKGSRVDVLCRGRAGPAVSKASKKLVDAWKGRVIAVAPRARALMPAVGTVGVLWLNPTGAYLTIIPESAASEQPTPPVAPRTVDFDLRNATHHLVPCRP